MSQIFNIYCDESCHLENDKQRAMTLGGVWCPADKSRHILKRIKEIKLKHGFYPNYEIKWAKILPSKINFYLDIVDYFFDTDDLHFRCLVVPDKSKLTHTRFNQSHDDWYYKMYFDMLKIILAPWQRYNVYLDIKDGQGCAKIRKLHEVLSNSIYDFDKKIIQRIQVVRSHEISIMQIADLFAGAMSYKHRNLESSASKLKIIQRIVERSGYPLMKSTLQKEDKFNIFIWEAS